MTASAPKKRATQRQPAHRSPAKREDWGQLGPATRALPNEEWRKFCFSLVTGPPGHGRYARAARAAGLARGSTPANLAKLAWKIAHDDRMIAAVAEQSRQYLRGAHPEAVAALLNMIRDSGHRQHGQAVLSLLDRTDPIVSKQAIEVTHRITDPDQEALEELRALRQIGATREKLTELFGGNGLARLERLEAADMARRSSDAKLIEVQANG